MNKGGGNIFLPFICHSLYPISCCQKYIRPNRIQLRMLPDLDPDPDPAATGSRSVSAGSITQLRFNDSYLDPFRLYLQPLLLNNLMHGQGEEINQFN